VFDALVYGKDAEVSGVGEPSVADQRLEASQYLVAAIGVGPYFFYMTGRGQGAERGFVNDGFVIEKRRCLIAQKVKNFF